MTEVLSLKFCHWNCCAVCTIVSYNRDISRVYSTRTAEGASLMTYDINKRSVTDHSKCLSGSIPLTFT